ncbi:hypothetical protein [Medusavirus stheno T3]|uniref:Uncharacterized protein n=1 Tax=Medusavirus stheno T3 TaxID=3069717 RepID=A0A7S7YG51_9VIRU|nr:hypothetical protein QKU73_gp228 [Acanthamoeba castellanii medusavirus]QPB44547.1 hypothetical protein [Medusavirus stheno T3]
MKHSSTYTARIECPDTDALAQVVSALGEAHWTLKRYVTDSVVAVSLDSGDALQKVGANLGLLLAKEEVLRWVMWIEK